RSEGRRRLRQCSGYVAFGRRAVAFDGERYEMWREVGERERAITQMGSVGERRGSTQGAQEYSRTG
uniref:Transposase n=1 Tax=Globodera pallida TaxID=36090 RepID=A0A183CST3_GLOPA